MQLLGDVFSSLTAAVGAADKVVELMQQRPAIPPHGALQPADFAGRLQLDSVTFSYPARPEAPVLNGLSLNVNPGEVKPWMPLCCMYTFLILPAILALLLLSMLSSLHACTQDCAYFIHTQVKQSAGAWRYGSCAIAI